MEPTIPLAIAVTAVALLALGALIDDRRTRNRRAAAAQPATVAEPPLIHSINDDRCIGCEACVDACPTNVLDLVHHKARVLRFGDCVQCEQCMNACPTTALVMHREGTTPQTLTVPEIDDRFQTGVPGQYLIGEVAGKPLVKNAANLGRAVVEHIARELAAVAGGPGFAPPRTGGADLLDVVVVGSGPAGLSAGLTCLHRKLSCVVLEKEHVIASTVSRYPKGKLFMAEPVNDRNVSLLPVFDATKEDLVAAWQKVVEGTRLPVKLGESVETVKRGDDGIFTIKTTVATYRSRNVVLATGLRGKPRLLAVPGANLEKVLSRLDDPDRHAGEHVLVVGGGDSAVEAAIALSAVAASVVLSYRGDGFKRCKPANQKRLAAIQDAGKLDVFLSSNVKEFTPDAVSIQLDGGEITTRPNQRAFVLIGADTPVAWLEANNVKFIERPHLYALGSTEETVRAVAADVGEGTRDPAVAIAAVLGKVKPASRASKPAMLRTMVTHIRDEFREVLTSVSVVARLPQAPIPPESLVRAPRLMPRAATSARASARAKSETGFETSENTQVGYVVAPLDPSDFDDAPTRAAPPSAKSIVAAGPPRAPAVRTTRPRTPGASPRPRTPAPARQPAPPLDPREFEDDGPTVASASPFVAPIPPRRRPLRGTPGTTPMLSVPPVRGTDQLATGRRAPARASLTPRPVPLPGLPAPVPVAVDAEDDHTDRVIIDRGVVSG